uniref:STAS domain-containing protein n=1 Tax=Mesocestoides corti TaxID=53468 RepID=A0A5K3EZE9_MESCO
MIPACDTEEARNGQKHERNFYTQPEFDALYHRNPQLVSRTPVQRSAAMARKVCQKLRVLYCGERSYDGPCGLLLSLLHGLFPVAAIMCQYESKNWLANDLITGFTVGVMHVPQGMAYAMLATLPPVYGLYCSMCAPLFYFLLGTSRHLSLGTMAVVSLLVGGCLDRNVPQISPFLLGPATMSGLTNLTSTAAKEDVDVAARVVMAAALAMIVGLIQLAMGILRLGFLTQLLSQPMLSGFILGSSIHVGMSQLFVVFGLHIKKSTGLYNVPMNFYRICSNLPESNWVTFGLALACMMVLYTFQLWVNPPLTKRIRVPIPIELLIIVFGGITSYYLKLGTEYNVRVVGTVPTGFPEPSIPNISLAGSLIGDAFVIALIAYSLSYSLASFYASKEGYTVDPNQELVAYGMTNVASSFFQTYPLTASISRTALQVTMGSKTQLTGVVSSLVVLMVVLFAGPLFYDVPNCCLAAIILVALRNVFNQIAEIKRLWRYSIWDFASWAVTLVATVFLDVIYGLIIGITFSVLTVFIRAQLSNTLVLGRFDKTEVFKPVDSYADCVEVPKVKVIRYEGDLFYAGAERFAASVIRASGFDPRPIICCKKKLVCTINEAEAILKSVHSQQDLQLSSHPLHDIQLGDGTCSPEDLDEPVGGCHSRCCPCRTTKRTQANLKLEALKRKQTALCHLSTLLDKVPLNHLILDCSAWNFIDFVGVNALKMVGICCCHR